MLSWNHWEDKNKKSELNSFICAITKIIIATPAVCESAKKVFYWLHFAITTSPVTQRFIASVSKLDKETSWKNKYVLCYQIFSFFLWLEMT